MMSRRVLPFVMVMLIIASAVYGQQQPAVDLQAIWDNADKNKDGFIDRLEFLDSIGIPILRLPSRPHDTKARWGRRVPAAG